MAKGAASPTSMVNRPSKKKMLQCNGISMPEAPQAGMRARLDAC